MGPPIPYHRQRTDQKLNPKREPKLCRLCDRVFPNRAELILHLQRARLREPTSHHHCHICAVVFNNDEERSGHIQKFHALQAKLICPCCRCGPFLMPTHLMAHLKAESCPAYNGDIITKFAAKSESVRSLQTPQWSAACQSENSDRSPDWSQDAKTDIPRQGLTQWSQIRKSRLEWKSSLDAWGKNTVKVYIDSNSQPATARQAPNRQPTSKTSTWLHDPNHASFNAERYMSEYSGRYTCPKDGCTRTFKAHELQKFKGHLKTHLVTREHQCPSCCKRFQTAAALMTHMEHQESGCELQQGAGFGAWLLKETGGIVTSSSKSAEGKSIFETTLDAQRELKSILLSNIKLH